MKRPSVKQVEIRDGFWTPYLRNIREVMLPYVFDKFEEIGYLNNFREVAKRSDAKHVGPPFSDGLVMESLRGACDLYAQYPTPTLRKIIDKVAKVVCDAADADPDGFLCTCTTQNRPESRWGANGVSLVINHDLYNHGCLIEAGISHYLATGETALLDRARRAADYICRVIGPDKVNEVPGHSLPEEAFIKLYRLTGDEKYPEMVRFWYDGRGSRQGRNVCTHPQYSQASFNQDHAPFGEQRTAEGHAVRAMLCYLGAAAFTNVGAGDYRESLQAIWKNVIDKRLHISGGVGARHDIEGFDVDYNLPNDAYLETCAAVALCFWSGEMSLLWRDSQYMNVFEQALSNNVLASIGQDFMHYFYDNPLISDGSKHRWDWHGCPCCPPMLLKLYGSLSSYIYAIGESLRVDLYIGSRMEWEKGSVEQNDRRFIIDSKGRELTVYFRIPAYAHNFELWKNGEKLAVANQDGYVAVTDVWRVTDQVEVRFATSPVRVVAHAAVEADAGRVAVQYGPYVMCAEGEDDGELAEDWQPQVQDDTVMVRMSDGRRISLIPYYRWCNNGEQTMRVWLRQQGDRTRASDTLYYKW